VSEVVPLLTLTLPEPTTTRIWVLGRCVAAAEDTTGRHLSDAFPRALTRHGRAHRTRTGTIEVEKGPGEPSEPVSATAQRQLTVARALPVSQRVPCVTSHGCAFARLGRRRGSDLHRLLASAAEPVGHPCFEVGDLSRAENNVVVSEDEAHASGQDVQPLVGFMGFEIRPGLGFGDDDLPRLNAAGLPCQRNIRQVGAV
jgi:hypothetical protein